MTKVISISDRAYDLLLRLKAGRSFSKVIEDIAEKNVGRGDINHIRAYFGMLKDKDISDWLKDIEKRRKAFRSRD